MSDLIGSNGAADTLVTLRAVLTFVEPYWDQYGVAKLAHDLAMHVLACEG